MNNMPRLLNLMYAFRIQSNEGALNSEGELLLAFVSERSEKGNTTTVSDVVRSGVFGTAPTVQRNVNNLLQKGLLETYRAPGEYRKISIKLTARSEVYMSDLEKLVHSVCC